MIPYTTNMADRISATELARKLGDVLGRVRCRGESFIVERNGTPVARLEPVAGAPVATVCQALTAWRGEGGGEPDLGLADALERVGLADRPPENPWAS
jgi:prevent-host-death family protein